jgi:hypothetical protein
MPSRRLRQSDMAGGDAVFERAPLATDTRNLAGRMKGAA